MDVWCGTRSKIETTNTENDDDDDEEEEIFDDHELNIIYPLQHVADAYLPASLTANACNETSINNVLKSDDDVDVVAPSIQTAVEHEDARTQMKFDSYDHQSLLDQITS
eukprot:259486_1